MDTGMMSLHPRVMSTLKIIEAKGCYLGSEISLYSVRRFWPELLNTRDKVVMDMSLVGKKFMIDPGHGGDYDGVTSGTQKEKDIVLKLGLRLRDELQAAGAIVYMTRTTDVDFGGSTAAADINNRVDHINSMPSVLGLMSLHINTSPFGRVGPFHYPGYMGSKGFADAVGNRMGLITHTGDFAVIRDTTVANAKILIECGQIGESAWNNDAHYTLLAQLFTQACDDFFG